MMASGSIVGPVTALIRSRFDETDLAGITIDIDSVDGTQMAVLDRLAIDKAKVRAGETVEVQAYARTNSGKIYIQRIPLTIPAETPAGTFTITVGDGGQVQKDSAVQYFVPKTLSELISTMNKLKSSDRLYAVATRSSSGVVIGANEMPNLPPSMLATLNNDRTAGGVRPVVNTIMLEQALPPAEMIITGQQSLSIEVIK
jgi:hypothetical protein